MSDEPLTMADQAGRQHAPGQDVMRDPPTSHRSAIIAGLFGQICRATPNEARALSMMLAPSERADMALFCYNRTHTREQGRAIAAACEPGDLLLAGGEAGRALLKHLGAEGDTWGAVARPEKRRVSLAGR